MRLACIYALLDHTTTIRPTHLKAALAVWSYCESSVEFIFGDMTGNLVADHIKIALKSNKEGLSRTEINNALGRHRQASEIEAALKLLLKNGEVACEDISTDGRSKEVWRVAK
jgi:hypothetical protein